MQPGALGLCIVVVEFHRRQSVPQGQVPAHLGQPQPGTDGDFPRDQDGVSRPQQGARAAAGMQGALLGAGVLFLAQGQAPVHDLRGFLPKAQPVSGAIDPYLRQVLHMIGATAGSILVPTSILLPTHAPTIVFSKFQHCEYSVHSFFVHVIVQYSVAIDDLLTYAAVIIMHALAYFLVLTGR